MKKILCISLLFSISLINAQEVVVEEKFEKDNMPLGYSFLSKSNKLVVQKGKHVGISTNREIHHLYAYDSKGTKKILLENDRVMNPQYREVENVFVLESYSKLKFNGYKQKVLNLNGEFIDEFKNDEFYYYANDKKYSLNFQVLKDNLSVFELSTKQKKVYTAQGINFSRIMGGENYFSKNIKIPSIKINPVTPDSYEIITKSISKDCSSSKIYRTIFDLTGKIIKEFTYEIKLPNKTLVLSVNGGGRTMNMGARRDDSILSFTDDGSVNNYITDEEGNTYVYGLFGENKNKTLTNNIQGYYIYKFDKDGNRVWDKYFPIEHGEKKVKTALNRTKVSLSEVKNNLLFAISTDAPDELVYYAELDKNKGNVISTKNFDFKVERIFTLMSGTRKFILSFYTNKESLNNKVLDYSGLIFYDKNVSLKNYINKVDSNNKIFFNTEISKEGIWLIESDNETYYKITYFNHE